VSGRDAGQQLIQHGAVRLRHNRTQQRSRGDNQHLGSLGVLGRVKQQAEVAVRRPAGLQDLAVRVGAELRHCPSPAASEWVAPGYRPGAAVDLAVNA
jgi:hypothetical protein